MLTKIPFGAGTYTDDSPLSAEGFFIDADKRRPVRGKNQTIGGREKASTDTLVGITRGGFEWTDYDGNPYAVFGTHLRLYLMDADGNIQDITPVVERGQLTNPFDTTDTSTTVTVNDTAHGLLVDQKVGFANASAVGGITIDGEYTVVSVVDANSYTITHSSAATSTVSGGGGTVDYKYSLAPGQEDGIGGLGYGTGTLGSGGYGSASEGYVLYPRTWTFDRWGQNVVCSPRGGTIYEFAPNTTATELVTTGDFASDSDWTKGAGWAIGSGTANATTSSAALTQSITTQYGAWHILEFEVTAASAGTLQPSWKGTNLGSAISSTGKVWLTFYGAGTGDLSFTGSGFTGSIDNVSVKVMLTAQAIPNAPSSTGGIFVTESRQIVALGSIDSDGEYDPTQAAWCDTGVNTDWTKSATNLAGKRKLGSFGIGSILVAGKRTYGENIIFGNNGLVSMRATGDPSTVFDFDTVATGCGLIGPLAPIEAHGSLSWPSPAGGFYRYSGGIVTPLDCYARRYIFDNLAKVQQDKVFGWPNTAWNENWWHYPVTDNEVSHYVIESYLEPAWTVGKHDLTTIIDASVFPFPLGVDTSGSIWFLEKDFSEDGGPRSWEQTTGWTDLGDGDEHMLLLGIEPDHEDLQGGYFIDLTMRTKNSSGVSDRTYGPYAVNNNTGRINVRATGQQMKIRKYATDAPSFQRDGADRYDIRKTGRRR